MLDSLNKIDRFQRSLDKWLPPKAAKPVLEGSDRLAELMAGLIPWAKPLLEPYRYKCLYGGRGSGKSTAVADCLLIEGVKRRIRALCAREFQESIKESVHHLLAERIDALGLQDYYEIRHDTILGTNGTQFIFKGVRHNVSSIKSMSALTHLWIEEAQTISKESWRVLVPTIREEGSEIWVTFNPVNRTDIVYTELVEKHRPNAYVRRVNWDENPYFPQVLEEERSLMQATDIDAYQHIWEGGFWERSQAQIFGGKWVVQDFEPGPDWDGPYHGGDWGFGAHPTAAIRSWIFDRCLWIERESYAYELDLDDISTRWIADIPGIDQYIVRADSALPATIKHVAKGRSPNGDDPGVPPIRRLIGAEKWRGSVEDGIAHLRSYDRIVIHPRCKAMQEEARLYSYKVDRLSGEVLPIIIDAHNHLWDALRYSLEMVIKSMLNKNAVARVAPARPASNTARGAIARARMGGKR